MNLNKIEIEESNMSPQILEEKVVAPEIKEEKKKSKKKKGFWDKIWNSRKLKKPNTVAIIYLRNNGTAEPLEIQSKEGFFNIYGKTYHENRDCIWSITKSRTPLAIIPEWSLIPIGTRRWEDKTTLEKFAELQDHTLRGIRHAEFVRMGGDKMNINAKAIIGFVVLGIIGIAIASQYLG